MKGAYTVINFKLDSSYFYYFFSQFLILKIFSNSPQNIAKLIKFTIRKQYSLKFSQFFSQRDDKKYVAHCASVVLNYQLFIF